MTGFIIYRNNYKQSSQNQHDLLHLQNIRREHFHPVSQNRHNQSIIFIHELFHPPSALQWKQPFPLNRGDRIAFFTGVSVVQMLRKRTMTTGVVYQPHVAEAFANGALNFTQRCTKRLDTFELTLNECNIRYTYAAVLRKLENVKKRGEKSGKIKFKCVVKGTRVWAR